MQNYNMKYLALDVIDTSHILKPDELSEISITMRGTRNLFDIFFSSSDIETSFTITLPPQIDFTWINTPSGKEKYLSYPTLKRMLFPLRDQHHLIETYLTWIDSLLFANTKVKPFFRKSLSNTSTDIDTVDMDSLTSDIDDTSSVSSIDTIKDNSFVISALEHKIGQLEHLLELKIKDIELMDKEIKLRDKEIELLTFKLDVKKQESLWI